MKIPFVDLKAQYSSLKSELDSAISEVIESCHFLRGPWVDQFEVDFAKLMGVEHCVSCANGTDALQIALMALELKPGDEIICPSWSYISTAETASLLGIKPVFCDVDRYTFNMKSENVEKLINKKTKAIIPVHLYGQSCDMEPILMLASKHKLKVIEDNAQSIGCKYTFSNGEVKNTGTMGDIATTSFYPTKNLGAYGDGGAIFTNDDKLAKKIKMIANHSSRGVECQIKVFE